MYTTTQQLPPDLTKYPPIMNAKHLVSLGLYPTVSSVYMSIRRGTAPEYMRHGRKILFLKKTISEFIMALRNSKKKRRKRKGDDEEWHYVC